MRLGELIEGIPGIVVQGDLSVEITALTEHSKSVSPGTLFFAKRGKRGDPFILEAIAAGAVAIVIGVYDPLITVTQLVCSDVHQLESVMGKRFYKDPSRHLAVIGVTGTSGKTTTTYLLQHLLPDCGLVGTIAWKTGKRVLPSSHTTPDNLTLLRLLHEMRESGCSSAAIEVSSHALEQRRIQGIVFSAAVYTNLSQEHLDYHLTMEQYAATKASLFHDLDSCAVINGDDPWSDSMVAKCRAPVIRYGFSQRADVRAAQLQLLPSQVRFVVEWKGQKVPFETQLIGRFNVYNILAATTVALQQGMELEWIRDRMSVFAGVPGRLERVDNERGVLVFVDYAHKPDALENVLKTLRECVSGKVIALFGCGGDRDRLKRPLMASIAEKWSDKVVVTSDNPRTEDPEAIISEIVQGFATNNYFVEVDRRKGIEKALSLATQQDVVLVAGKGHENCQIFAHETVPFDDRVVIQWACRG